MDWITAIKEIQKAQEDDRLVIFVGAGVSKNSGVPAWWDLIKKFADELEHFDYLSSEQCYCLPSRRWEYSFCRQPPKSLLRCETEQASPMAGLLGVPILSRCDI